MSNIAIQNLIDKDSFSSWDQSDMHELARRLNILVEALYQVAEQTIGDTLINQNTVYYSTDTPADPTVTPGETPPTGRISGTFYVSNPDGSTKQINVVDGWIA